MVVACAVAMGAGTPGSSEVDLTKKHAIVLPELGQSGGNDCSQQEANYIAALAALQAAALNADYAYLDLITCQSQGRPCPECN